ncbi:MAG: GAF domain-containing sensor histidine kinase [Actinobacteria bacterium]|nr:GAF domain-containing sensor histidine kinase [Actinomycetota bacterium]
MVTTGEARTAPRPRRALGRGLFVSVLLLGVAIWTAELAFGTDEDVLFTAVASAASLAYAGVGSLIVARQPRNTIGWLLYWVGVWTALTGGAEAYTAWSAARAPDLLPFTRWVAWLGAWTIVPLLYPIPLLFLLFPTGRPPSRRWRVAAWAVAAAALLGVVGFMVDPSPLVVGPEGTPVRLPNPTGIDEGLAGILLSASGLAAMPLAFLSVVALVRRFRRSRGDERQQIRWLAYTASLGALLLLALFASFPLGDHPVSNSLFYLVFLVVAVGIPLACGIAILRHRLFDLDVVIKRTVVFGALAAFGTVVYVGVVVGLGALFVGADTPALTFAGAAIVAVAFQPVRARARRLADRLVYGKRATPYEVLSGFAGSVGGTYASEDVLPRMAEMITAGTGASRAEVWLRVGSELRLGARAPATDGPAPLPLPVREEALPPIAGADHALPVVHHGELLGAIAVAVPPSEPLVPAQGKLLEDLAAQAGLLLRNARLIEELRASRQRLVAAQDQERRRIERNLHDGAQQQLVALAVKVRLAQQLATRDAERAAEMLAAVQDEMQDALQNLRDLARGIYPPLLADQGLGAALRAQAGKSAVPVEVAEEGGVRRFAQEGEAAVYFCVLEALQNVAKYAGASRAVVRLRWGDADLRVEVEADGAGVDVATVGRGAGLQNMSDRLAALGGELEVRSAPGAGTTVAGRLPAPAAAAGPAG